MSTLQSEVIEVIGAKSVWKVRLSDHILRFFWAWAIVVGLLVGLVVRQGAWPILIGGGITAAASYLLAERHLRLLDHAFFSSRGNSKREIFDRHFAKQVSRDLSLRMTEPGALHGLSEEQARAAFARALDSALDREFRKFDWRFFVREVVRHGS